jgi:hypothetical protein
VLNNLIGSLFYLIRKEGWQRRGISK